MKIRTGFVSNSSSSSFIIAVDKDVKNVKCDVTYTITEDIAKYTEERLTTAAEVIRELHHEYGYDLDSPIITQALNAINNGKHVLMGSFCDDNRFEELILCNTGLHNATNTPSGFEVIVSEEGY